jgi:hypothetical protein
MHILTGTSTIWYGTLFNTASSAAPVSEDAEIEPRTLTTSAMALRRSNHSARFHPVPWQLGKPINGGIVCSVEVKATVHKEL